MDLNIPMTQEKNVRFVFPLCLACIITTLLRPVCLMWLPFLIGHPYSSGIWQTLQLRMNTKKDTCHDGNVGLYVQNRDIVLDKKYNSKCNWEGSCDRLKSRKKIFTWTFCNFCIAILVLELELENFVICNCCLDEMIQSPI